MKLLSTLLLMLPVTLVTAQTNPPSKRSQLSIMIVPYTSGNENVLARLEKDPGYKEAIAGVQTALLNAGYSNLTDFKTRLEVVKAVRQPTAKKDPMKTYIENAPADIFIETEIVWVDPPGQPAKRQAKILLKAVDKYTGAVYSNNASIQSNERDFANLPQAVNQALAKDAAASFQEFLEQLDVSYERLIREGRPMHVKFEVDARCDLLLTDKIGNERLSDKIRHCIRDLAMNGDYKSLGETSVYMSYMVRVPVLDDSGKVVRPGDYLSSKIDQQVSTLGFDFDPSIAGAWINFILQKKLAAKR